MSYIPGLMSAADGRPRGCVLVSQMSSEGALTSQEYIQGLNHIDLFFPLK